MNIMYYVVCTPVYNTKMFIIRYIDAYSNNMDVPLGMYLEVVLFSVWGFLYIDGPLKSQLGSILLCDQI